MIAADDADIDRPLLFEREGPIARLTLNRPNAADTIDVALAKALMEASVICDEDDAIRCVLLTGAGKFFYADGDVGGFAAAGDNIPALLKALTDDLHVAVSWFARMRKPLVTAVNGTAAGVRVSLAILGDIVVAARSASFTLAYTAIGLSPDGGGSWILPWLIGMRRAQELMLTNKRIRAAEAAGMGMITRAVDDDSLAADSMDVVNKRTTAATLALSRTRNLLLSSLSSRLEDQLEHEARAIADCGRDDEGREGVAAFLARRKPDFKGNHHG